MSFCKPEHSAGECILLAFEQFEQELGESLKTVKLGGGRSEKITSGIYHFHCCFFGKIFHIFIKLL
jgi:hypothetical protein